jgi:hypothetical protein
MASKNNPTETDMLRLREKNLFKMELKPVDKFSIKFCALCHKSYQSKDEYLRIFLNSM